jgi:uncharacterized protein (TIGR03437 family)
MKSLPILISAFLFPCAHAQLECQPDYQTLPFSGAEFTITDAFNRQVNFAYGATYSSPGTQVDDADNFVLLFPSSGTTPAVVNVGLNPVPAALFEPGGTYAWWVTFTSVGQSAASTTSCYVHYAKPAEPSPSIQAVVNAASFQSSLAPGALVSILGTYLTGPTLSTNYGPTASYPTSVANTSVTFNGIAASLLYVSPTQINAIVPSGVAGQTSAQVVVQRFSMTSAAVTVPLQDTAPAVFTATQNGSGQGAILQLGSGGQFTYNSSTNPAAAGTALEIFATGAGMWSPAAQSDVLLFPSSFTTQPVSVTIGGQAAKVLYTGTLGASLSLWSLLQVNVIVPSGAGSGSQPVVLKIGASDNTTQKVTMWVQ